MCKSKLSTSRLLIVVMLALTAAFVAACGGTSNGGGSDTGSNSGEDVTLTVWDYYGAPESDNKQMNELYAGFEAENPGVTVKRTTVGYPEMRQKLVQAIATGQMPDIAIIDNVDLPVFASQPGALADLTQKFEEWPETDQYFPSLLAKYEGKYWYMPFRSNTLAFFYNKDLLKEAGFTKPPGNWDELRSMAKALTKGNQYGFCFSAAATSEGDFQMLPFLWQAGGSVENVADEAGVNAMQFLREMFYEDKSIPQGALSWGQLDVGERFNAGTCAMMMNGPWQITPADEAGVNYGVSLLPKDVEEATVLGGENIIVSASAPLDTAWKLLTYLQDPKVLTPQVVRTLNLLPIPEEQLQEKKYLRGPAVTTFSEALKMARSRAIGPEYAEIQPHLWTMEQQVLTGEKSPEEATAEAAQAIEPLLEQSG